MKYLFILLGILSSASAQMLLKKASFHGIRDFNFYVFFGLAGFSYLVSFVLYTLILKLFPLNKISPVMTCGTMIMVLLGSYLFYCEALSLRHIIGIVLGIISIFLIIR